MQLATLLERLKTAARSLSMEAWVAVGFGLFLLVVAMVLWRIVARRRAKRPPPGPDLTIDVAALGQEGPPAAGPVLELYNLPVRLAALVLAPVSQAGRLPPEEQWPQLCAAILPGLDQVVAAQRPLVRRWPGQLSVRGFARALFANARLPGDGGKETPWSSVAGIFKTRGQPLMAGLIVRAQSPNSVGQTIIEHETQWLGCLRVKVLGLGP
ncbi:MAG: hypothetical protein ACLQLG_10020 [Thermoguttaceae bacterium]